MAAASQVIVLAAGASSRMGSPKPLLDFDGRACIEVVLDACRAGGAGEAVVVLGFDADRIRRRIEGRPFVTIVLNERPERGQTSSVKAGVGALRAEAEGFFILPNDYPLIEGADLAMLRGRLEARQAGKSIWISSFEGRRGHPVLLAASHRESVLKIDDGTPLRDYLRARGDEVEVVEAGHSGVVTGINTPEEYRAALDAYRRRRAAEPGRA